MNSAKTKPTIVRVAGAIPTRTATRAAATKNQKHMAEISFGALSPYALNLASMFQQVRKESISARVRLARLIRNALHRAVMQARAAEALARIAVVNGLSLSTRRPICVVESHAQQILTAFLENAWTVVCANPLMMILLAFSGSGLSSVLSVSDCFFGSSTSSSSRRKRKIVAAIWSSMQMKMCPTATATDPLKDITSRTMTRCKMTQTVTENENQSANRVARNRLDRMNSPLIVSFEIVQNYIY